LRNTSIYLCRETSLIFQTLAPASALDMIMPARIERQL
jgi:hypothetical protein